MARQGSTGLAFRVRPHRDSAVARHDAPLIDERAASRRRTATEDGDERSGATRRIRSSSRLANRIEPRNLDEFVGYYAPHDAPLIDERAATRGRVATEGGDGRPE
jgi:hypothetical protein